MARLRFLTRADLSGSDRDLLARDLNLYRVLAHSPAAARAFAAPALYSRHDSPLDPRLRELAIIQVGYSAGVAYEYAHHVELGLDSGLTPDDILAVALETTGKRSHLPPLESAVLRCARQLVEGPDLSDADFACLADSLSEREIVDLIMVISVYCGVVRLLGAFAIELEDGYDKILAEFPLPDRSPRIRDR